MMQIYCAAGKFSYCWMTPKSVRIGLRKPFRCDDRDGPYTKIRFTK